MKKRKSIIIIAIVLVIGMVGLSIWNGKAKNEKNDTVKIGVIMPQTGFLASPGQNVINGIRLFVDEFNNKHKEKRIEIVYEDSKSEPKIGVSAINKLINVDKVKLIIGDLGSPIFLAMAPIAEKNKVVMISPGASNPKVSEAGDYIFRIYTSDEFDGKVMANYLIKRKNVDSVALLYFNNDYGVGLGEAFLQEYSKLGGSVSLDYSFDENSLNFKDLIMRIKKTNVEDVYFIASPKQDAAFLRQIKEANCKLNIYGVLSFEDSEFLEISKHTFDSVEYSTSYFDLNSEDLKMQKFKTGFFERYNKMPDLNAALGYDVANILVQALENSDYQIDKVKTELYRIKDFPGLTGNMTFDSKGDVLKDVMIKQVKGDGSQRILEVFNVIE